MTVRTDGVVSCLRGFTIAVVVIAVLAPALPLTAGTTCQGDVDNDLEVGFADLISVLAAWGPHGDCPPPPPEDLTGNCIVDFEDLLIVLALWGPCPPVQTGACCLPGGCVETDAANCGDLGGAYLGDASECPAGACGAGVTGACCRPNGTCVEVDVPACQAQGGAYQGAGVECMTGLCP